MNQSSMRSGANHELRGEGMGIGEQAANPFAKKGIGEQAANPTAKTAKKVKKPTKLVKKAAAKKKKK